MLQKAGISWQVYTNHEVGDGGGVDGWVDDYGDNPLWFYQQYEDSENAPTKAGQELAIRGAVQPWQPNAGVPLGPNHVNHVLAEFVADATKGTLPQVSWIVAPYEYSEHPAASPSYGAHYVRTVLEALLGNQDLWNTTALFITHDEHDGSLTTLPPNDLAGHQRIVPVTTGHSKTVDWPTDADGYYDVTVTADTGDGFTRRYAGRIA